MPNWQDELEMDADGRLKRKRFARDRERITFATISDQTGSFRTTFADGTPDYTSPHRKGFRFADTNDEARLAADEAYEQRRIRVSNAWRNRDQQDAADPAPIRTPSNTRTHTNDELQAKAIREYESRNARMRNAWRHD